MSLFGLIPKRLPCLLIILSIFFLTLLSPIILVIFPKKPFIPICTNSPLIEFLYLCKSSLNIPLKSPIYVPIVFVGKFIESF